MQIKAIGKRRESAPRPAQTAAEQVYLIAEQPERSGLVESALRRASLKLRSYSSAEQFLYDVSSDNRGVVVTEANLPGISGVELHHRLIERGIDLPVIVLTDEGDIPTAVRALEAGALDCVEEPVHARALVHRIRDALSRYHS